jgi:hypothetical protein
VERFSNVTDWKSEKLANVAFIVACDNPRCCIEALMESAGKRENFQNEEIPFGC